MAIVVQETIVALVAAGAAAVIVLRIRQAAKAENPETPCANCPSDKKH